MDIEYASRGVGNAALTTGIIGTAAGAMTLLGGLGNGSGLFGLGGSGYSRDMAAKDAEIAELKSQKYSDKVSLEVYAFINGKLTELEKRFAAQEVKNQSVADSFALVTERLNGEVNARKCADNTIVNYANNTFYPKLVAAITTGTETTAQNTYNPLPCIGGNA